MPSPGVLCRGEKPHTGQSVYRPSVTRRNGRDKLSLVDLRRRVSVPGSHVEQTRTLTVLCKMAQHLCCFKGPTVEGQREGHVCTVSFFTTNGTVTETTAVGLTG